jgi:hypothetical protein
MGSILEAFATFREGRDGDEMYQTWDKSVTKYLKTTTIPITLKDEKKKSALGYSDWGLKNFKPWYLADLNSAKNDDFVFLMMDILERTRSCMKKQKYWFFRGDCNVFKMWIKVFLVLYSSSCLYVVVHVG